MTAWAKRLFPEPLEPTTATISPRETLRLRSRITGSVFLENQPSYWVNVTDKCLMRRSSSLSNFFCFPVFSDLSVFSYIFMFSICIGASFPPFSRTFLRSLFMLFLRFSSWSSFNSIYLLLFILIFPTHVPWTDPKDCLTYHRSHEITWLPAPIVFPVTAPATIFP